MHSVELFVRGTDERLKYVEKKLKHTVLFAEGKIDAVYLYSPATKLSAADVGDIPVRSVVFCGGAEAEAMRALCDKEGLVVSYNENEQFLLANAALTAEAAFPIILEGAKKGFFRSRCLIIGYGRIGKLLAEKFLAVGADFAVASRTPDRLPPKITAIATDKIEPQQFDVIVNTASYLIFDDAALSRFNKDCTLFELASKPGCAERDRAAALGVNVVALPSLPARIFPERAGNAVLKLMENYFQFLDIGGSL